MKNHFVQLCVLFLLAALPAFTAPTDGTWAVNGGPGGPHTLILNTGGTSLTGTLDGVAISNGKVEGNLIWFTAVRGGVAYNYKGTASGGLIDLHETRADGSGHRQLSCTRPS